MGANATGTAPAPSGNFSLGGPASLGMQQFFQLLVAQLQNQDPMQPMDNTQFITQLAQFSSLQSLQAIQTSLDTATGGQLLGAAMSLIGKQIAAAPTGGAPVSGTVSGVQIQNGNILLEVGNATVSLADVQEIKASTNGG
jgi:flagellar basal-body rod modification protein FlgD